MFSLLSFLSSGRNFFNKYGIITIAVIAENPIANIKLKQTSLNICPTRPLIMSIGINTMIVVRAEPRTETATVSLALYIHLLTVYK